jgi:hypothetical protein
MTKMKISYRTLMLFSHSVFLKIGISKSCAKNMEPEAKRLCDFGHHWSKLSRQAQHSAELSALLNWDDPNLEEFRKARSGFIRCKTHLITNWGGTLARMSLETGIVLSLKAIDDILAEGIERYNDRLYHRYLFQEPAYSRYVILCAERIAQTKPGGPTLFALHIVNDYMLRSESLALTCKYLWHKFNRTVYPEAFS